MLHCVPKRNSNAAWHLVKAAASPKASTLCRLARQQNLRSHVGKDEVRAKRMQSQHQRATCSVVFQETCGGPDADGGTPCPIMITTWQVIKLDIMGALAFFHQQHGQHLLHLNKAHMVLLPKKADAQLIGDFRPISLTHSIAKLISKILAVRLSGGN